MGQLVEHLRAVCPRRPLNIGEALRVADLQATKLLAAMKVTAPAVPESVISSIPHVEINRVKPLPASMSGGAVWMKGRWMIVVNAAEPLFRQRFSIAHETKHIIDAFGTKYLYPPVRDLTSEQRAEQVCDQFAASLLMPRTWVMRYWREGIQDVALLARLFLVSKQAMRIRLESIGLLEPAPRCLNSEVAA